VLQKQLGSFFNLLFLTISLVQADKPEPQNGLCRNADERIGANKHSIGDPYPPSADGYVERLERIFVMDFR